MATAILYVAWGFVFVLSIPFALNLVPPNGAIGFRTAKTLSSPEVWSEANALLGWALIAASLVGLWVTCFKPDVAGKHGTLLLVSLVGTAIIISFIYVSILPG